MTAADSSYGTALGELAVVLPKLAATLERAERHRARNTASLVGGARFKGSTAPPGRTPPGIRW